MTWNLEAMLIRTLLVMSKESTQYGMWAKRNSMQPEYYMRIFPLPSWMLFLLLNIPYPFLFFPFQVAPIKCFDSVRYQSGRENLSTITANSWMNKLHTAGVFVLYGFPSMKTPKQVRVLSLNILIFCSLGQYRDNNAICSNFGVCISCVCMIDSIQVWFQIFQYCSGRLTP